uniref:Uncharacterized protein n=1 Tax=Arundo donax TaxID=35708 RepID=A0A0A9HP34_ARUDO
MEESEDGVGGDAEDPYGRALGAPPAARPGDHLLQHRRRRSKNVGVRGDALAVGRDDPHVGRRCPERVEVRVQRHRSPFRGSSEDLLDIIETTSWVFL